MDPTRFTHVHAHMRYVNVGSETYFLPAKAYDNPTWLNSSAARPVRVLAELLEPLERLESAGVRHTILFFGSARARAPDEHAAALVQAESIIADPAAGAKEVEKAHAAVARLTKSSWMCDVYVKVQALAKRLTEWSMARMGEDGTAVPYIVATGGGPGLMEAANRGASEVPGAINAGIAISLPFEAGLNQYVTPELGFQHHYYFTRKYVLSWPSRALVVCAGGYGSLDECFEILTLLQSGKIESPHLVPVVMFPGSYWRRIVNWEAMVDAGVIADSDVAMLHFTDDVDDAFNHITAKLALWEAAAAAAKVAAADAAKRAAISAAAAAYRASMHAAHRAAAVARGVPETAMPPPPLVLGAGAHVLEGADVASPVVTGHHDGVAGGGPSGTALFTSDGDASPIITPATIQFARAHSARPGYLVASPSPTDAATLPPGATPSAFDPYQHPSHAHSDGATTGARADGSDASTTAAPRAASVSLDDVVGIISPPPAPTSTTNGAPAVGGEGGTGADSSR